MATPRRLRTWVGRITIWFVRIFFTIMLAFPFYWMLITTFKRTTDLYNLKNNPFVFNEPPTAQPRKWPESLSIPVSWVTSVK